MLSFVSFVVSVVDVLCPKASVLNDTAIAPDRSAGKSFLKGYLLGL
jgi:hypothetical protein